MTVTRVVTRREMLYIIKQAVKKVADEKIYDKVIDLICKVRNSQNVAFSGLVKRLKYEQGSDYTTVDYVLKFCIGEKRTEIEMRYANEGRYCKDHVTVKVSGELVFDMGPDLLKEHEFEPHLFVGELVVRCFKPGLWIQLLEPDYFFRVVAEDMREEEEKEAAERKRKTERLEAEKLNQPILKAEAKLLSQFQ